MQSICVFCGANKGRGADFENITIQLGESIATRGWELVYGAGNVGLMGILANSVLAGGGQVTGVIPDFLKQMEVCHQGLTELIVVETMHKRKEIMAMRSDGFFVLPGGFGTLDEFFEILTWKQLRLHQKPVGLLNYKGYYDHLIQHLDVMVDNGFLHPDNRDLVIVDTDFESLLNKMEAYKTPEVPDKWLEKS
ncbi:MAG: TIGR00730 family Rossman fold protein [Saprospiraceae bacterium]